MVKSGPNASEAIGKLTQSKMDSNRLYSILLDARSTTISENMYDVSEKLLQNEKLNAKSALEHLWSLKKNMQGRDELDTVDMLIQFYQDKMDVMRNKEEYIKKVSKDSRLLLEEKRKRDAEIATIKQEIGECTRGIAEFNAKLETLRIKEQELQLIESQVKKELLVNENEVVSGLYEIILSHQEAAAAKTAAPAEVQEKNAMELQDRMEPAEDAVIKPKSNYPLPPALEPLEKVFELTPAKAAPEKSVTAETAVLENVKDAGKSPEPASMDLYARVEAPAAPAYPKSVVKTTRGTVIGEYYYDSKAYKNKRHYVFNSQFFLDRLSAGIKEIFTTGNQNIAVEMLQMVQDAYKRITQSPGLHFENSTNEIVNDKTLKELWQQIKSKDYAEAGKFCARLQAKISFLGLNYRILLQEQMDLYNNAE
ncbi:MAG: hypothetical protein PHC61_05015 [Chitinivibrionales bacterium]|nr:hypothetical protein [Chitinivibrionales bacterium]